MRLVRLPLRVVALLSPLQHFLQQLTCRLLCVFLLQVDRSVVELFGAGGRAVATARVYPGSAASVGVGAFNAGRTNATLQALDAWEMGSAGI